MSQHAYDDVEGTWPGAERAKREQISALREEIARLTAERDTKKRHLDAIAEALHPHKPKDGGWTYLPDQLAEMVTALKRKNEALRKIIVILDSLISQQRMSDLMQSPSWDEYQAIRAEVDAAKEKKR